MVDRSPTRIPLAIHAEWKTRFWTTTPPVYIPHTEWSVTVTVGADTPTRLVRVDDYGDRLFAEKERRPYGEESLTYELSGLLHTEVEPEPGLLARPWSALGTDTPAGSVTWSLIPLITNPDGTVRLAVIAFPREDTEHLRGARWRIRESLRQHLPIQSAVFDGGIAVAPATD